MIDSKLLNPGPLVADRLRRKMAKFNEFVENMLLKMMVIPSNCIKSYRS